MDKKKIVPIIAVAGVLLVGIIIIFFIVRNNSEENAPDDEVIHITVPESVQEKQPSIERTAPSEPESTVAHADKIKATINGQKYQLDLNTGFGVSDLKKQLPFTLYFHTEDNAYVAEYNAEITRDDKIPDSIQVGDIMLKGNQMYIFYSAIDNPDTEYTYIGNIQQFYKIADELTIEFNYQ